MTCSGCNVTGITEYNYNGLWGYYDEDAANELSKSKRECNLNCTPFLNGLVFNNVIKYIDPV